MNRRQQLGWVLALTLVLSVAGTGTWWWLRVQSPPREPPTIDLVDADPAVIAAIEKACANVRQTPRSPSAWGKLAALLTAFNYRAEALDCFAEAERLDPSDPRWPYHRGVLLLLDDPKKAIPCLRRAVECGDRLEATHLRLSEALFSLGQFDEAEAEFLRCPEQNHPRVQLGLGRIALRRERWEDAQKHLEAASRDRQSARSAAAALADFYQRRGEETKAADYRGRLERLPPDAPWHDPFVEEIQSIDIGQRTRLARANQLFQRGNTAESVARLQELLRDYPDSREGWFALGQILHVSGDYKWAEKAFRKVVDLAPDYAEAHNYLGAAQLRQGKLDDAIVSLRKAIELKSDFALAYCNLGRCLLQRKDAFAAVDAYRTAVHLKPDYAPAHTELAVLLHQLHKDDEALEQARVAVQLNPGDEGAKKLLRQLEKK
jgi:tetratricopeptide (TPR) repeat protein